MDRLGCARMRSLGCFLDVLLEFGSKLAALNCKAISFGESSTSGVFLVLYPVGSSYL